MLDFHQSLIKGTLRKVLKRLHHPLEVMLTFVRWYVAEPLRLRHVEEMTQERGVSFHYLRLASKRKICKNSQSSLTSSPNEEYHSIYFELLKMTKPSSHAQPLDWKCDACALVFTPT